mmetsp:Transcript_279/g.427  ORF Transcript_279/g.427 Transcript_279/m.427 type:complete len:217 (+) Transcript_279:509-1159(+)
MNSSLALDLSPTFFHPLLRTTRSRTTPEAPSSDSITSAPSKSKLSTVMPSPLIISEDRDDIFIFDGSGKCFLYSAGHTTNDGFKTTSGPATTLIPSNSTGSASSILQPIEVIIFRVAAYWSASPVAATPGAVPLLCSFTPSAVAFFTGEKHNSAAILVNPTHFDSSLFKIVGKSCIIHSNLVGFLKIVFASSAYLGLTNSGIAPWVRSIALVYGLS